MSDHHPATSPDEDEDRRRDELAASEEPGNRGALATAWNAITAVLGGIMGLLPHMLHHVGPLGGAVLVTGATGNVLFGLLGLVFSLPLLRRLYRRLGTWKAPALALAIFALMFSLSAFVIGPAINDSNPSPDQDRTPGQTPSPDGHEGHHGG